MAYMRNLMEKSNKMKDIIDSRYDLSCEGAIEILDNSRGVHEILINGFRIGYLQGMKATLAKMKRGEKVW